MTRLTRRAMLAATGTAFAGALAGCSQLNPLSSTSSVEYDDAALAALPDSIPDIPPTTPVQPSPEHVANARNRIRSLLDDAALSEIPNDVVRQKLARNRDTARDALSEDTTNTNRVEALSGLTHPRSEAMFVNAGMAAFDGDLTPGDVASRRERHRQDADAFLEEYTYVGPAANPVAAFAEHATIADWGQTGARIISSIDDHTEYGNTVLRAAGLAQDVEWGRAYAADARRLHDHYTSTLDNAHDYGPHFAAVAASLVDDVRAYNERPDIAALRSRFDRNIKHTAAGRVIREVADARAQAARTAVQRQENGRSVLAIAQAMHALVADRALAAVTDAISNGAYGTPDSVEPIAAERTAAVDGLRTLLDRTPAVLAYRLARYVHRPIHNADRSINEGTVSSPGRYLYAEYAIANHYAAAARDVLQRVSDALDA